MSSAANEWVAKIDSRTGRTYYYNKFLKQTAWTKPTNSPEEQQAWVQRSDPQTGEFYYFNNITKARSAENPLVSAALPGPVPPKRAPAAQVTYDNEENMDLSPLAPSSQAPFVLGNPMNRANSGVVANRHLSMGSLSGKRHVSVKLNQLNEMVARYAPTDEQFSKLKALQAKHTSNTSDFTTQKGPMLNLALLAAMNQEAQAKQKQEAATLTFTQYAQVYFNTTKKMFGSAVRLEDLMVYSDQPLKRSLLKLTSAIEKKALQASKLINGYMSTGNPGAELRDVRAVLKLAINNAPQELRDEIFCQLLRQLTGNPEYESSFHGWQLLALFCGAFPPSKTLENTLRNFIDANTNNTIESNGLTVGDLAAYARLRLDKSVEVGPRKRVPCAQEVESTLRRQPVEVPVWLVNKTEIKTEVETWMTISDLRDAIASYVGLLPKSIRNFSIIEMSEDSSERALLKDDRVLDILSEWEEEYLSHKYPDLAPKNYFIFRLRLFLPLDKSDQRAIELTYYQAVFDINDGRYFVGEEELVRLLGYQMQEKFGDWNRLQVPPGQELGGSVEEFREYFPEIWQDKSENLRPLVITNYKRSQGLRPLQVMEEYLQLAESVPFYGCAIYLAKPMNNPKYPVECLVAISGRSVFVVDPRTRQSIDEFRWEEIVTYGYNNQNNSKKKEEMNFSIVMGDFLRQTTLYFTTYQAFEIYKLLEAYGNKLKGYGGTLDPEEEA